MSDQEEPEVVFVSTDGRLTVWKGGSIAFRGLNEKTGAEETYSTAGTADTVAALGRALQKFLQVPKVTRTTRIGQTLGVLPGDTSRQLELLVGRQDALVAVIDKTKRTSIAFPHTYSLDELLRIAEAMIEAGRE